MNVWKEVEDAWFSSNEPRLDKETSTGALKLISEMSREAGSVSLETGK